MTFNNLLRGISLAERKKSVRLLANQTPGSRIKVRIGAPGVDVQSAASGVAGINAQAFWRAEALDVGKDALNALLVKFIVMAE